MATKDRRSNTKLKQAAAKAVKKRRIEEAVEKAAKKVAAREAAERKAEAERKKEKYKTIAGTILFGGGACYFVGDEVPKILRFYEGELIFEYNPYMWFELVMSLLGLSLGGGWLLGKISMKVLPDVIIQKLTRAYVLVFFMLSAVLLVGGPVSYIVVQSHIEAGPFIQCKIEGSCGRGGRCPEDGYIRVDYLEFIESQMRIDKNFTPNCDPKFLGFAE